MIGSNFSGHFSRKVKKFGSIHCHMTQGTQTNLCDNLEGGDGMEGRRGV